MVKKNTTVYADMIKDVLEYVPHNKLCDLILQISLLPTNSLDDCVNSIHDAKILINTTCRDAMKEQIRRLDF